MKERVDVYEWRQVDNGALSRLSPFLGCSPASPLCPSSSLTEPMDTCCVRRAGRHLLAWPRGPYPPPNPPQSPCSHRRCICSGADRQAVHARQPWRQLPTGITSFQLTPSVRLLHERPTIPVRSLHPRIKHFVIIILVSSAFTEITRIINNILSIFIIISLISFLRI